jgi:hypothetical protein
MMYLFDTWKGERTRNWWIMTSINVLLVLIGSFTMVAGESPFQQQENGS